MSVALSKRRLVQFPLMWTFLAFATVAQVDGTPSSYAKVRERATGRWTRVDTTAVVETDFHLPPGRMEDRARTSSGSKMPGTIVAWSKSIVDRTGRSLAPLGRKRLLKRLVRGGSDGSTSFLVLHRIRSAVE